MANTIIIYSGDGKTTDFKVPFDYLKKSFVKILVNGRELVGGNYGDPSKDYYFLDPTTVRLLKAPPTKAKVVVKRFTSATERVVSFKDASILKAKDLDASTLQATHIAEEGRDVVAEALFMDKERNWDAKNKRIVNLADPVDDTDAINYKTYKEESKGAYQARLGAEKAQKASEDARDIAVAKAQAAVVSETNAKESEVNAKASETKTKEYLDKAETVNVTTNDLLKKAEEYKVDFDSTAENVYTNAEVAKQKAQEASKSEANAKASENLSRLWATSDSLVEGIDYSSKYYAKKAKESADLATEGQLQANWTETNPKAKDYIKNKPSKFPPEAHRHPASDIDGLSEAVEGVAREADVLAGFDKAIGEAPSVPNGKPTYEALLQEVTELRGEVTEVASKPDPKGTLVESWKEGSKWYRKYSDGWIEQGGKWTAEYGTITFYVPFIDVEYTLSATPSGYPTNGNHSDGTITTASHTKTSFFYHSVRSLNMADWVAVGYYK